MKTKKEKKLKASTKVLIIYLIACAIGLSLGAAGCHIHNEPMTIIGACIACMAIAIMPVVMADAMVYGDKDTL